MSKRIIFNKEFPNGKIEEIPETEIEVIDEGAPDYDDVVKFISGLSDVKSLSGLRELGEKFNKKRGRG